MYVWSLTLSGVQSECVLSVTCLGLPYFSTLSPTGQNVQQKKKKLMAMKCVLIKSTVTFVRKIPHSKKNSARYIHKCTGVLISP